MYENLLQPVEQNGSVHNLMGELESFTGVLSRKAEERGSEDMLSKVNNNK